MHKILQEKLQMEAAPRPEGIEDTGWATDKSARDHQGLQTRGGMGRYEPYRGDMYNSLPPGMDIDAQEVYKDHAQPWAEGLCSGSQATVDVTKESLRKGYDRKKLIGTDDMATNEHVDSFYYVAVVDGDEGYVERGNCLDRM